MKITGGIFRGRLISFRKHLSVRPTASRVREAFFSILGQDLSARTFLDAFGGSGIMGLEASSRGAISTICEKDPRTAAHIRKVINQLSADVQLIQKAVPKGLGDRCWQDVFLDPPYANPPQDWLERLSPFATERVAIEFHHKWPIPTSADGFSLLRHARYGDSCLAIYTRG